MSPMSDRRLIVIDPGHFHAALIQKQTYPQLSSEAHVYAPLGSDLLDHLTRIARFNARPDDPTQWRLEVHAGPDFLDRIRCEPAGGITVISGRNRGKIEKIAAAVEAGLHVIADKPAIIRREDLPQLEAALGVAEAKRLILLDIMAGRHDAIARLIRRLRGDAEVFGEPAPGSRDEPGIVLGNVHHLLKTVAGVPTCARPGISTSTNRAKGWPTPARISSTGRTRRCFPARLSITAGISTSTRRADGRPR